MSFEEAFADSEKRLLCEAVSLAELLERLRSRVSRQLIGDLQWERLLSRVRKLPATLAANPFGFELPLHAIRPKADFGVTVVGGSRSAAFFEERGQLPDADLSTDAIARLLSETTRDASSLRCVAGRGMMLEYDIDSKHHSAHIPPGIFLYPIDLVPAGDHTEQRLQDLGIVVNAVVNAAGWDPDSAERSQVERLCQALNPGTWIQSVGAFPARERGIRIAVAGFRKTGDVMGFLGRVGWPGPGSTVAATMSRLEERGAIARIVVHLDARTSGMGPRLGLSFIASEQEWLTDNRPWTALIDGLREERLAVPEKLSALSDSWSGTGVLFGKSGMFALLCGVHHVKVVVFGDRFEQVKAYVFMLLVGVAPTSKATRSGPRATSARSADGASSEE